MKFSNSVLFFFMGFTMCYLIAQVFRLLLVERRRRRLEATLYLGGECAQCKLSYMFGRLQFHHEDPSKKITTVARLSSSSEEKFWTEVNKCILLCEDCHIEHHHMGQ